MIKKTSLFGEEKKKKLKIEKEEYIFKNLFLLHWTQKDISLCKRSRLAIISLPLPHFYGVFKKFFLFIKHLND